MTADQIHIEVQGMTCGHCARAVKELAEEVEGVSSAQVDLATKQVTIQVDSPSVSAQAIIDNINSSNVYKATLQ